MISYNKTWLANLRLQTAVKKWLERGNVTNTEYQAITEKYPAAFYTPNIFVRVGLFILTCIIVGFAIGLMSLVFASSRIVETGAWFFFLAVIIYILLEVLINSSRHYRSGVDDALLFISGCMFVTSFSIWLYGDIAFYTFLSGIVFVLYFYFSLRFADMLASAICCAAFFAFVFFAWEQTGPRGLSTVQFAIMLVSGGLYWLVYAFKDKVEFINYKNCIIVVQIVCLLTLYAAGNYYVIQTLSNKLNSQDKPISLGAFFWLWTMALPFTYAWFGIKKKDVILLRICLLLIAAAAATFRTYYHILPLDASLTIAGAIILGVVYMVIRYLKIPKHGFTLAEPGEANLANSLKIESLLVAQTFSHTPLAPANDGVKFGGGDFGGGGSSSSF